MKTEAIKSLLRGSSSSRYTDKIHLLHVAMTNKKIDLLLSKTKISAFMSSFTY